MSTATIVIIAAVILALCTIGTGWLFTRRTELGSSKARASARNAHSSAEQARNDLAEVRALVAAFREGRPADVDYRPTCPMDGEPLAWFGPDATGRTRYARADGLEHDDFSRPAPPARPAGQPSPPPYTQPAPVPAAAVATQANAVDAYFHRANAATEAGLIDPDRLRTGLGDITRNPEFTRAMQDIADRTRAVEQPPPVEQPRRHGMPDPTRAARIQRSRPSPPAAPGAHQNGDGS